MRSVLYLRMSTDRQEASIPQQREALVAFAAKQGHEIVGEYVDEGISGDATHKRRGFQAMIRDAAGGGFDRILCWDQSRFGRFDSIEAGQWITPLRDAGVSLETVDGGVVDWGDFAGRITYAVAQEGKHQFLRDLSRNALRGQVAKARAAEGMYGAPAPYGYRRETATAGRKRITSLVPHEIEAGVVKKIFDTYVSTGGTLLAVGELLNREGVPSPRRKSNWHRNAVRRILTNPVYVGDYVWGRSMSGKYHVRVGEEIVARRGAGRRNVNDPIVHRDALPALVSRETFDRAQELLGTRKKSTWRRGTVRPLSGLIVCAQCGSPMHVNFCDYRCSRSVDFGDGTRCPAGIARGGEALEAVVAGLRKNLLTPARLRATKARLERIVEAEREQAGTGDTAALEKRIEALDRQVAEGVARIPLLPKSLVPELAKNLDALRAQRDALTRQREALGRSQTGDNLPVEERVAKALAAAYSLRDALPAADPAAVNECLRNLGVRVYFDRPAARVVVAPLADAGEPGSCHAPAAAACTGTRGAGRRGSRRGTG
jgi:DNA invertase Pin-like site-specific DNA recombinase